jgi:hypothetical protein
LFLLLLPDLILLLPLLFLLLFPDLILLLPLLFLLLLPDLILLLPLLFLLWLLPSYWRTFKSGLFILVDILVFLRFGVYVSSLAPVFQIFIFHDPGWGRYSTIWVISLHLGPVDLKLVVAHVLARPVAFFHGQGCESFPGISFHFRSVGAGIVPNIAHSVFPGVIDHRGVVDDRDIF